MNDTIFIYRKKESFIVLDFETAKGRDEQLLKDGWRLVSTLKPSAWFQYFLNANNYEQEEAIKLFYLD